MEIISLEFWGHIFQQTSTFLWVLTVHNCLPTFFCNFTACLKTAVKNALPSNAVSRKKLTMYFPCFHKTDTSLFQLTLNSNFKFDMSLQSLEDRFQQMFSVCNSTPQEKLKFCNEEEEKEKEDYKETNWHFTSSCMLSICVLCIENVSGGPFFLNIRSNKLHKCALYPKAAKYVNCCCCVVVLLRPR